MYVEQNCAIELKGRKFEAGGAFYDGQHAIGYLAKKDGRYVMTSWRGEVLGPARIVATWSTPTSYVSSTMHQIEACIDGTFYTGRGAGKSMIWRGRRKAAQKWG